MTLADIIQPSAVQVAVEVSSKKRALEEMAGLLAANTPDIEARSIFSALIKREKLGSTGLGHGVGLPHGRIEGLTRPIGAMLRLPALVDFEASDRQGVDLLVGLIVPIDATEEHVQILTSITALCQDDDWIEHLRTADDPEGLYSLISDQELVGAAA